MVEEVGELRLVTLSKDNPLLIFCVSFGLVYKDLNYIHVVFERRYIC